MTSEQFCNWLADMQSAGLCTSDAHAGRMLGVGPHTIVNLKKRGADRRTALACRALLHRMTPYGEKT